MAQFRATIQGGRGSASRLGHKNTGIRTNTNGWNGGVYVFGSNHHTVGDVFEVFATGGSSAKGQFYIGWVNGEGEFSPSNTLRERIVREYLAGREADSQQIPLEQRDEFIAAFVKRFAKEG